MSDPSHPLDPAAHAAPPTEPSSQHAHEAPHPEGFADASHEDPLAKALSDVALLTAKVSELQDQYLRGQAEVLNARDRKSTL